MPGRTENSVKNRCKSLMKKKGEGEEKDEISHDEGNSEKDMEIKAVSPGFNTMMLFSPQIVNFEFSECLNSPTQTRFLPPSPVMMRPISSKIPNLQKIMETKERLKQETNDSTPSPSIFLHFRN